MQESLFPTASAGSAALVVQVYSDGGSRGNPGLAACAALVKDAAGTVVLAERARFLGPDVSNNVAEYEGVLLGLQLAREQGATEAHMYMDSLLCSAQLSRRWKIKHPQMRRLAEQVWQAAEAFSRVTYTHVYREENTQADALLNACLDAHMR